MDAGGRAEENPGFDALAVMMPQVFCQMNSACLGPPRPLSVKVCGEEPREAQQLHKTDKWLGRQQHAHTCT